MEMSHAMTELTCPASIAIPAQKCKRIASRHRMNLDACRVTPILKDGNLLCPAVLTEAL